MGIQVAAISRQIIAQLTKAQASGSTSDSQVQLGLNIEKMMADQEATAKEHMDVFGVSDPQCFTSARTPRGDELVMEAHKAARAVIREIYPHVKVGLTLSLHDIQALPGGEESAQKEWEEEFTHYLPSIAEDDFLGVQNYTRNRHDANGSMAAPDDAELTQMDYEYYPQGLEHVLRRVAQKFHGDLIVTENGIAGVQNCIADGLPIKGYIHWSLLDNFEWQKGFSMQFGLIAVDRSTQKRLPKPSLAYLGSYCG